MMGYNYGGNDISTAQLVGYKVAFTETKTNIVKPEYSLGHNKNLLKDTSKVKQSIVSKTLPFTKDLRCHGTPFEINK